MNILICSVLFLCFVLVSNTQTTAHDHAVAMALRITYDINHKMGTDLAYNFRAVDFVYKSCYHGDVRYPYVDSYLANLPGQEALKIKTNILSAKFVGTDLVFESSISGINNIRKIRCYAQRWEQAPLGWRIYKAEYVLC